MELAELAERLNKLECKHDELAQKVNNSDIVLARIETKLDRVNVDFDEIKSDLKALTAGPKKRWDTVIYSIIQTLITVVLSVAATGALYVGTHIKGN